MDSNLNNELTHTEGESEHGRKIELRRIFGNEAQIVLDGEKTKVELVLKDAACPGGQAVVVELGGKIIGRKYDAYKAENLMVDGVSLNNELGNTFEFVVTPAPDGPAGGALDMIAHVRKYKGTKGFDDGRVQIVSLEDADGLAAIFHEIGHTRDGRPNIFDEFYMYDLIKFTRDKFSMFNKDKRRSALIAAENVLDYEMSAHKLGIDAIQSLRDRGHDLFTADPELVRVKKFLLTTTIMRFRNNPKFVKLVGAQRINEILIL